MQNYRIERSRRQEKAAARLQQSRLLALPAELRNRIFELALAHETALCIYPWPLSLRYKQNTPPLLRTNRQIRDETRQLFHSQISVHIYAGNSYEMQKSKAWFQDGPELAKFDVVEVEMHFRMYSGNTVKINGFVDSVPAYELKVAHRSSVRGAKRELGLRVEALVQSTMEKARKNGFGVEEYIQFGDGLMREFYIL